MAYPEYQYRPLETQDTMRVLVLYPASNFYDTLRCDIIHSKREFNGYKNESYEAVSYAWEGQQLTAKLECHGSVILVTPTVESFLRHVRKSRGSRRLWIDSVCLNQKDSIEKGQQVYAMGDIYRQGRKCHVWLGEEREHDSELFAFFSLGYHCGALDDLERKRNMLPPIISDGNKGSFGLNTYPGSLSHILAPFRRPWFTRRWILQEVALSKRKVVRCGGITLQWTIFGLGIKCLEHWCSIGDVLDPHNVLSKASLIYLVSQSSTELGILIAYREVEPIGTHKSLLNLLYRFAAFECSDPRDRVFALLGFADDADRFNLAQYYSTSVEKLYAAVAAQLVEQTKYYELLELSTIFQSQQGGLNLPSWIPNWTCTPRRAFRQSVTRINPFSLAHHVQCSVQDGRRRLQMTGVEKSGTIRWTSEAFPSKTSVLDIASMLTQSIRNAENFASQHFMLVYYKDVFEMAFNTSKSRAISILESVDRIPTQEGRFSKIHALVTAFSSVPEVEDDAVLSSLSEQKFCLAEVCATRSSPVELEPKSNDERCCKMRKFSALRLILGPMGTRIGDEIWASPPLRFDSDSKSSGGELQFIVRPQAYAKQHREHQRPNIELPPDWWNSPACYSTGCVLARYIGHCGQPQDYGKTSFRSELGESGERSNLVLT